MAKLLAGDLFPTEQSSTISNWFWFDYYFSFIEWLYIKAGTVSYFNSLRVTEPRQIVESEVVGIVVADPINFFLRKQGKFVWYILGGSTASFFS